MVMAQSLFIALKTAEPDLAIDVLAPAWSFPLLERMPEVRRGVVMPVGHGKLLLGERRRLGRSLAEQGYDQAIVLPNSLKSALVPWFAGIPARTGWRGEMRYGLLNDCRRLDKDRLPLMVERFVALAGDAGAALPEPIPRPRLVVTDASVENARQRLQLQDNKPVLALCPGAEFGPSKRWPEANYSEVAIDYLGRGFQVWLFGSENDSEVCAAITDVLPEDRSRDCHNLAGRTSLAEAVDLLSQADLVLSNDSGLMHIAAALQRPLAVVYGSTSPAFTPPLAEHVSILSVDVDCGPCFQRQCPQQHHRCMKDVAPTRVAASLAELYSEGRDARIDH